MATDTVGQYQNLMNKANEYHKKALWQEKLRSLQGALDICSEDGFPEAAPRKQQVLLEIGGIRRRLGQHSQGIKTLNDALNANEHVSSIGRAKILGELGVVYRHNNNFALAQETFSEQYNLAYETAIEAAAEMCRAIGNEGMSNYNLFQQVKPHDKTLLELATRQLEQRIELSEQLHHRLLKENPTSRYVRQSMVWKVIGLDRLTLCYIACGATGKAVRLAKESQELLASMGNEDPTIRGNSRFFYGHTLWCNGERKAAVEQWSAPPGQCSSAISLCKEPTAEHVDYLKLLAHAGVDFDVYDEQGFSPLDYAVIGDSHDGRDMVEIILGAVRSGLSKDLQRYVPRLSDNEINRRIEDKCALNLRLAKIRRYYRAILQEHIRPELRNRAVDAVPNLRRIYANLMTKDEAMQSVLDSLHFITYETFKKYGRLPMASAGEHDSNESLTRKISATPDGEQEHKKLFIIFFSYRWIGRTSDPPIEGPDDNHNTQYRRMLSALDAVLKRRPDIDPDNVGIWLDCACINQSQPQQRERGVNSLPLAVTQCDAMISLVDEFYYTRAWCAVEVMLIQELMQSYRRHEWFEHRLHSPGTDRLNGTLRPANPRTLDVSKLELTKETEDRPKVDFLMRQSKLLGHDDA